MKQKGGFPESWKSRGSFASTSERRKVSSKSQTLVQSSEITLICACFHWKSLLGSSVCYKDVLYTLGGTRPTFGVLYCLICSVGMQIDLNYQTACKL